MGESAHFVCPVHPRFQYLWADFLWRSWAYSLCRMTGLSRACCVKWWRMLGQVSEVQQAFVEKLLEHAIFSKHLAAVREINIMLRRALEIRALSSAQDKNAPIEVHSAAQSPLQSYCQGTRCIAPYAVLLQSTVGM